MQRSAKLLLSILFIFPLFLLGEVLEEKPMVVVVPSYNNINWYHRNLISILSQNYSNFRAIYVDDLSKDGTGAAVEEFLKFYDPAKRFQLIRNTTRKGAMANLYYSIHSCKPEEIVVMLDGDDWFYHENVLKHLNEIYSQDDIWFTHGSLIEYPWGNVTWCEPFPEHIIENRNFRRFKCPSHLRTCYAWLFQKIALEDFLYEGEFLKMAWDMAIMYPLAEMAGKRHAFVYEANYVYNMANPINDNKVDPDLQNRLDRYIRNKPPYQELEGRP